MVNAFIGLCRHEECDRKDTCERYLTQTGEVMQCHLVCEQNNLYWKTETQLDTKEDN